MKYPVTVYHDRQADVYIKWNGSATYNVYRISTGECVDCFTNYRALTAVQAGFVAVRWFADSVLSDPAATIEA